MAERETRLRWVRVDYVCDDCGQGLMKRVSQIGGDHEHRCERCGAVRKLDRAYPVVKHVDLTDAEILFG